MIKRINQLLFLHYQVLDDEEIRIVLFVINRVTINQVGGFDFRNASKEVLTDRLY